VSDLPTVVAGYAARMHRAIGTDHHVASPLGAWLVLALAAPAAEDDLRPGLEEILGMPVEDAADAARTLLKNPPDVAHLAAAAWHRVRTDALDRWLTTLPPEVEAGPVPTQADADAWADRHTHGLIKEFPLKVDWMILILASAIACDINWRVPFETVPAERMTLLRAPGFSEVRSLLAAPAGGRVDAIVENADGLMAVHASRSEANDMHVVSVIADPDAPAGAVLDHAHVVATAIARGATLTGRVSLFDLPLGLAHSWNLTERVATARVDRERFEAVLPAWSADSEHDLMTPGTGFDIACEGLRRLVDGPFVEAKQVAVAEYTRTGFKAAAITVGAVAVSAVVAARQPVRTAQLEFTHPHAVVAVATGERESPWTGMPLFSAWVTQANEAT
jgi:hypothetical protein